MSKPRETLGPPTSAGFYVDSPTGMDVTATPDFASDEAAELWHELGQPDLDEPSGKTGYTVADVKAAAEEND